MLVPISQKDKTRWNMQPSYCLLGFAARRNKGMAAGLNQISPIPRTPHVVEVELTNDCNQKCVHCPRNQMTRSVGYMALPTFSKIVDEMACYPYAIIRLVGLGEAAMHPNFAEMLEYAKARALIST